MFERTKSLFRMNSTPRATTDGAKRSAVRTSEDLALYVTATKDYEDGAFESADRLVTRLIEQNHDWAEAHFLLGEIRRNERRWEDAADCYTLAICFKPELTEARVQLGVVLLEQNRAEEAAAALE